MSKEDHLLLVHLMFELTVSPKLELSLVQKFSGTLCTLLKLANDTIGYIDWKPHIPTGDGDCVLEHLQKLFRALHSFFHPSNTGRWTVRLSAFLQTMPFMVVKRLHRERYRKPSWHTPVPESHRLKETDITQFVQILKPAVFTAMFGKGMSQDAAIRNLALLRPEIIIPPLLEKMYPAMETLIEPHRLISCMFCIVSAARPMLSSHKYFPEGRNHMIPLLHLALPGIDPNDFKKTLVTLQMVSTYAALVPIVDCSEAPQVRTDLTEQEAELCSATAQFEDFVLEFLNRIISMIENSAQDAAFGALDRLTAEQSMAEVGLASTVTSVLQQCSKPIFMSALHKINRFVTENVYETKVSGRLAANLCRAAARVRPEETLKLLLPPLCEKIQEFAAEHPDLAREEQLDNSFLWNMLMLSQLLRCNGEHLLPYKEMLLALQGYEIAGQVLRFLLRALTLTYPLEFRSVTQDLDQPLKDYLPIRDWAIPGDMDHLDVKWHMPSKEEQKFATTIAETFLQPQLDFIHSLTPSTSVPKEDLQRRLHIIIEFILGSGALLPAKESKVPLERFCCTTSKEKSELTLQGRNIRAAIADAMRELLKHMHESREDDTKSMFKIIQIFEIVMMFYGTQKADVDARWKSFRVVKAALQNLLNHRKKHIRPLLVDRIQLLHELRSLSSTPRHVTARHLDMINDLLELSVSRYREVRKRAQGCVHTCFNHFHYTYLAAIPHLVKHLKNPEVEEARCTSFWGSGGKRSLATRRNWEVLSELWPAISQAQHYEKPSILQIVDAIITKVVKSQETVAIKGSVQAADRLFASSSHPKVVGQPLSAEERALGEKADIKRNAENLRLYTQLVEELVALVESGKLTWKFSQNAMEFLALLIRDDTPFPPSAVRLFTKRCISDLLYSRKLSLAAVSAILQGQKRRKKKVVVDIAAVSGTTPLLPTDPLIPGDRPDNKWHQYDSSNLPTSKAEWDACTFVPKTHLGYYCWPKNLLKYAPESEQPKLVRTREELPANEVPLYDSFSQPEFVEKLLEFLALEEQKGRDKFQLKHLTLFKAFACDALATDWETVFAYVYPPTCLVHKVLQRLRSHQRELILTVPLLLDKAWVSDLLNLTEEILRKSAVKRMLLKQPRQMIFHPCSERLHGLFRNFGDTMLEVFKPHLERLTKDTSHNRHDSSQRCAMEVLSGLIRGSKHWPYEKLEKLWDWLVPLLSFVLSNITIETLDDWRTFFTSLSESRDPRQLHWLFELLMKNPISAEGGAFGDSSRLVMLQQALVQQEWRVPELLHRLLEMVQPHLNHPYKAVRDQLGSILSDVFLYDYHITDKSQTRSPLRSEFLVTIVGRLNQLKDVELEKEDNQVTGDNQDVQTIQEESGSSVDGMPSQRGDEPMETERDREYNRNKQLILLCKTVMKWLAHSCIRCFNVLTKDVFPVVPVICNLLSVRHDEELHSSCRVILTNLSAQLLTPEALPHALHTIKEVAGMQSWNARVAILHFIQISVFGNFFLLQSPESKLAIQELLLHLLCDERLEVREVAAMTLSGLMHCGFLEMNKEMMNHFEHLRRVKLKKRNAATDQVSLEKLIKRHAGVLGLSACVQAHPYDVPDFIPQVLMDLSIHVNDPQPIQMTVKKTLSDFRRTHHDNWHDHKQMFTDDQLVVLTDLLISPNYYA
ncbi:hypothetical protein BaRGS_00037269 [Batillaria attramentaria]|uniref:Proteasome activator subunit 4 n=1 Tax=Batillaria attramentaria TaxID=370345 RepID=A0ABD0J9J0_9CAEN